MHKYNKFFNNLNFQYIRFLPWLILIITLLSTYVLWQNSHQIIYARLQTDFERYASDVNQRIERRIQANQHILAGLQGLYAASNSIDRKEFYTFISRQSIDQNLTGIQAIGFSLVVPKQQKYKHIATIRKEGFPDYTIKPAGERDVYTSILYIEPFNNINQLAFGYDMYTDSILRDAMRTAQDSNHASLSGKITLVASPTEKKHTGIYMYLPVYINGKSIRSIENRRAHIYGWIYMAFNIDSLMQDILGAQNTKIDIHLYDGKEISIKSLLHDFDYYEIQGIKRKTPLFQTSTQLNIAGHIFTTIISSQPDYDTQLHSGSSSFIALSGSFISILVALLTWLLVQGREHAIKTARRMTKDLRINEKSLIASKHQAESSLSELNSYLKAIDKQALISVSDPNGVILSANTKFCITSGYSEAELIDQNHNIVNSGIHSKEFFNHLWKTISSGEVWRGEICNRAKNGELYWVDGAISPLKDKNGKITQYISVRFDITKRKLSEAHITEARKEAERANAAKSEFIASMSHELRTPLNAIIGFSQLLKLDPEFLTEDQLSSINEILSAGNHLLTLVNQVLDLATIESGKLKLKIEYLPLNNIINECQNLISPLAEQNNIQIEYGEYENYFVNADALRTKQVLVNFLSNAIKYNKPNGKVTIQYELLKNKRLRISVTDTGYGLDEQQLTNLFIPFERAGAEFSSIEGTGIGLALCKNYIEAMSGAFGVTSNINNGCTFWFELDSDNQNNVIEKSQDFS